MKNRMEQKLRLLVVLSATVAGLTSCPGGSAGQSGIAGQVTAPQGGAINATEVAACPVSAGSFSCANARTATLSGTGASAAFQLKDLTPGQYVVVAIKDVNGSGSLDVGDWYGTYPTPNTPTPVTPPSSNINFQMGVIASATSLQGLGGLFGH